MIPEPTLVRKGTAGTRARCVGGLPGHHRPDLSGRERDRVRQAWQLVTVTHAIAKDEGEALNAAELYGMPKARQRCWRRRRGLGGVGEARQAKSILRGMRQEAARRWRAWRRARVHFGCSVGRRKSAGFAVERPPLVTSLLNSARFLGRTSCALNRIAVK